MTRPGRQLRALVAFLGVSYGAAALGSAFTFPALKTWYRRLRKPTWTPPDRVFGPVWTMLYTQMAISAWLVRRRAADQPAAAQRSLVAWAVQLALNVAWSAAFFGARKPLAGVLVIVPMWLAILATLTQSARVSRMAGVLLVPYLAWTSYATALNLRIWRLNRD